MKVEYDQCFRMKYHPEYHFNHGKPYTARELSYICKHYRHGNRKNLSMAVGRTEATISHKVRLLRLQGLFDYYKNMDISDNL